MWLGWYRSVRDGCGRKSGTSRVQMAVQAFQKERSPERPTPHQTHRPDISRHKTTSHPGTLLITTDNP